MPISSSSEPIPLMKMYLIAASKPSLLSEMATITTEDVTISSMKTKKLKMSPVYRLPCKPVLMARKAGIKTG